MRKLSVFVLLFITVSIAHAGPKSAVTKYEPPDFAVEVRLTEKAKQYLLEHGETVIVSATFADDIGPDGNHLGNIRRETVSAGTVAFKNIEFPTNKIRALANLDYEVLINVVSGRRSIRSNILDCGIVQERVSTLKNKSIPVECDLGKWAPR